LAGQESRECCAFISEVGIRGIYLSLTLGTAKFKELDESCFSKPGQAQIYNVVSIKPILPNILFDVQIMQTLYDIRRRQFTLCLSISLPLLASHQSKPNFI
jgi:hypothetical protein